MPALKKDEKSDANERRRMQRMLKRRREACRKLGIVETEQLLYGAQAAADALGVSVGTIRKHVTPDDTAENPYYRRAGAPVGLYDPIELVKAQRKRVIREAREKYESRKEAAEKATRKRVENMEERMRNAEIKIVRGKTNDEIFQLAIETHGGNYRGDPGPFVWSNRTAHNCIRHNLTNYEQLWGVCNRGATGESAYEILRDRVEELIDEAYPQFSGDPDERAPK